MAILTGCRRSVNPVEGTARNEALRSSLACGLVLLHRAGILPAAASASRARSRQAAAGQPPGRRRYIIESLAELPRYPPVRAHWCVLPAEAVAPTAARTSTSVPAQRRDKPWLPASGPELPAAQEVWAAPAPLPALLSCTSQQ